MNNSPIGVFDSGVGGLTAVKELKHLVPNENIVYFGDTARVPYGTRSEQTVLEYANQDIDFLLSKGVKLIVAACGTVSSIYPEQLRNKLPVPFFGVVESTANAALKATKNKKIGVIGTAATIRSESYKRVLLNLDSSLEIVSNACPLFIPLVENGFVQNDNHITYEVAKLYLAPMLEKGVDTLILGCTHFPIISNIIKQVMGDGVTLIDPGYEIAKTVCNTLDTNNLFADKSRTGTADYYVSDTIEGFSQLAKIFLEDYIDNSVTQHKLQ